MEKKNQKIKKPHSGYIFSKNRDEIGQKTQKKILLPNSIHTQPWEENSKNNSKKIEKIKKPLSGIMFC